MRPKNNTRTLLLILLTACGGVFSTACGASKPSSPAPSPMARQYESPSESSDGADGPRSQPTAQPAGAAAAPPSMTSRADKASRSRDESESALPSARPGLATHWGETRQSQIRTTSFFRGDERPTAVSTLFYNDREGSRAMAASEGYRSFDSAAVTVADGAITISLRDDRGRTLSGYSAGGRVFAVGEPGDRYIIVLRNHSSVRFEAVVTVDGLDVIDGKPGSPDKRGYLVAPHGSVEIEGFRRSESEVAAFRFGSVRGSYAAKKGDDRNVGVVGLAVFHERGASPPWFGADEIDRRKGADPFPGRFATPPLSRYFVSSNWSCTGSSPAAVSAWATNDSLDFSTVITPYAPIAAPFVYSKVFSVHAELPLP